MSEYQTSLLESKREHVIKNWIILGLILAFIASIGLSFYLAKTMNIKIDPAMPRSVTMTRGEVSPIYVFSFAERTISKVYRWKSDGMKDYKANIELLSNYITPICKKYLLEDADYRFKTGELTNRVRRIDPAQTKRINELVISNPPNSWDVRVQYDLYETMNGLSIKEDRYYWDVRVIKDNSDVGLNQYGLLLDCPFLSNTPKKINQEVKAK